MNASAIVESVHIFYLISVLWNPVSHLEIDNICQKIWVTIKSLCENNSDLPLALTNVLKSASFNLGDKSQSDVSYTFWDDIAEAIERKFGSMTLPYLGKP